MTKLERELNIKIPENINNIIKDLDYEIDEVGRSNSCVVIFEDYILKITKLSFDVENEIKIYNELKGKLPIPKIVEYKIVDDKIYLLKTKLKGKMLCDEYYMKRPELLFKLASEAIKLLWSVDIKDLDLPDSFNTIYDFGKKIYDEGYLDIKDADKNIVEGFKDFKEIFDYIINNKPQDNNVLSHGDLCITNIICDGDKLVGFIDLGLMGKSNKYHDLAILYRSIKYNYSGVYGKAYPGYDDNKLFELIGIEKNDKLIKYYLLLDELLG